MSRTSSNMHNVAGSARNSPSKMITWSRRSRSVRSRSSFVTLARAVVMHARNERALRWNVSTMLARFAALRSSRSCLSATAFAAAISASFSAFAAESSLVISASSPLSAAALAVSGVTMSAVSTTSASTAFFAVSGMVTLDMKPPFLATFGSFFFFGVSPFSALRRSYALLARFPPASMARPAA